MKGVLTCHGSGIISGRASYAVIPNQLCLYYCNALSVIKELSTDKNTQNRTISRKEFIEKLKTVDQQFEVWLLHKNGIEHFAKTIKKKYFNSIFNVSPYERFFLIECSRSTSLVDLNCLNEQNLNFALIFASMV